MKKLIISLFALAFGICNAQVLQETVLQKEKSNTSDFFSRQELAAVVALEAHQDALVGAYDMERVIVLEDMILIQRADECVLAFQKDGKFLFCIEPDNTLIDFTVLDKEKQIVLYTDNAELSFYSMTGKLQNTIAIPNAYYEGMVAADNNMLLFYYPYGINPEIALMRAYDFQNNLWSDACDIRSNHFDVGIRGEKWVRSNHLTGCNHLSNEVLCYKENKLSPIGSVSIPNFVQKEFVEAYHLNEEGKGADYIRQNSSRNIVYSLTGVRENEKFLTMMTNEHPFIWIDKTAGSAHWSNAGDPNFGSNTMVYFPHSAADNQTMFCIYPATGLTGSKYEFVPSAVNYDKIPAKLADQVKAINGSNTVLLFYKEK